MAILMTRVLHILDHSLPLQSGYTFRTRAILKAQEALGHSVRCVTGRRQEGQGPELVPADAPEVHDGLLFHRTPGQPSGSQVSASAQLPSAGFAATARVWPSRARTLTAPRWR